MVWAVAQSPIWARVTVPTALCVTPKLDARSSVSPSSADSSFFADAASAVRASSRVTSAGGTEPRRCFQLRRNSSDHLRPGALAKFVRERLRNPRTRDEFRKQPIYGRNVPAYLRRRPAAVVRPALDELLRGVSQPRLEPRVRFAIGPSHPLDARGVSLRHRFSPRNTTGSADPASCAAQARPQGSWESNSR